MDKKYREDLLRKVLKQVPDLGETCYSFFENRIVEEIITGFDFSFNCDVLGNKWSGEEVILVNPVVNKVYLRTWKQPSSVAGEKGTRGKEFVFPTKEKAEKYALKLKKEQQELKRVEIKELKDKLKKLEKELE